MNLWPTPRYPQVMKASDDRIKPIVIAGPCFAEPKQMNRIASHLAQQDITYMRGGVYRAGTYPPADGFGLQEDALNEFVYQAKANGLKTILEVIDLRLLDRLASVADALQVGARHMQDYTLLNEIKHFDGDVTIKRGVGQNMDEFLGAVEYLMGGKCKPILIERGSSTYHNHCRWDLSISMIPAVKAVTGLPIIVDASHGTGRADLVEPMTLAGVAAGADGWLVECHPCPEQSLSDANQAISIKDFVYLNAKAKQIWYL
jgi:3-deoxy-7-phosphoheptulonate synthase